MSTTTARVCDPCKIPIRATMFSSLVMVAYLFLGVTVSQMLNDVVPKTITAIFVAYVINVFRCPLTVLVIFKSRDVAKKRRRRTSKNIKDL